MTPRLMSVLQLRILDDGWLTELWSSGLLYKDPIYIVPRTTSLLGVQRYFRLSHYYINFSIPQLFGLSIFPQPKRHGQIPGIILQFGEHPLKILPFLLLFRNILNRQYTSASSPFKSPEANPHEQCQMKIFSLFS